MEEACEKMREDKTASLRAEVAKTVRRAKVLYYNIAHGDTEHCRLQVEAEDNTQ